jgi:hypothetical protein
MGRMDGVTIRAERPGEAEAIRAINDAAFEGIVEGRIVDAIRGTDRWIEGGSIVAARRRPVPSRDVHLARPVSRGPAVRRCRARGRSLGG